MRALAVAAAEVAALLAAPSGARADDALGAPKDWAIHGQATFVVQAVPSFHAPYSGPDSLAGDQAKETFDATLQLGVRPWAGAEIWANPEVDQGFGLSDTLGVAGFPSAEAYKVGRAHPYVRLQRLFLRQTIGLGGARQDVAPAANQLGGATRADRIVLTIGKFGVGDVFDTNRYAHDPRGDFLNWAMVDTGTFDYAADAWGYSYGAAIEWYRGAWTVRAGAFNLSTIPNGEVLEHDFSQFQIDGEIEHRHSLNGRPGAVRMTGFINRGRFGRYADALAYAVTTGGPVDLAPVRRRMTRPGIGVNVEQELTDTLGLFARAGIADGSVEPYDFTDIDRTASVGLSLGGAGWGRKGDRVGLALVVNGISAEHRRYLAAGGLGILIGDGKLPHAGPEAIVETYYDWAAAGALHLALDCQFIADPGYNRDRGPVGVLGLRAHAEF